MSCEEPKKEKKKKRENQVPS